MSRFFPTNEEIQKHNESRRLIQLTEDYEKGKEEDKRIKHMKDLEDAKARAKQREENVRLREREQLFERIFSEKVKDIPIAKQQEIGSMKLREMYAPSVIREMEMQPQIEKRKREIEERKSAMEEHKKERQKQKLIREQQKEEKKKADPSWRPPSPDFYLDANGRKLYKMDEAKMQRVLNQGKEKTPTKILSDIKGGKHKNKTHTKKHKNKTRTKKHKNKTRTKKNKYKKRKTISKKY